MDNHSSNEDTLIIADETTDSITYKPSNKDGRLKRSNKKTEKNKFTKVELHYYDKDDFNALKEIESEISKKYLKKRKGFISKIKDKSIKFLVR